MTARSTDEAINAYKESKRIFNDLGMNLRQFLSNDQETMRQITQDDWASSTQQKVLGVTWHSKEDRIILSCKYPTKPKITKRSIAEQVAAIYDPMGWLTPLTLRGKLFFQDLWNFGYKWDTPLSKEHTDKWKKIVEDLNEFETYIPRRVSQIGIPSHLILFADASKRCMATCAYLISNNESHLLTGKSKLPSIKTNPTIPKLELNALTMVTRLAHSICTALRHHTAINQIIILSDSEIALSWIRSNKIENTRGTLVKNHNRRPWNTNQIWLRSHGSKRSGLCHQRT